jgi:membrane protease YdiL (CAAX protease family)
VSELIEPFDSQPSTAYEVVTDGRAKKRLAMGLLAFPLLAVVGGFVFSIINFFSGSTSLDIKFSLPATFLTELIVIMLVVSLGWGGLSRWKEALLLTKPTLHSFAVSLWTGLGLYLTLQALAVILVSLGVELSSSDTSNTITESARQSTFSTILVAVLVSLGAPLVEELLFRGAVMNSIRNSSLGKYAVVCSLVASSVFFSLAHFQGLSEFIDYFTLGWIFIVGTVNGLLALKYKSVWPAIFAHASYNGITMAFVALSQ